MVYKSVFVLLHLFTNIRNKRLHLRLKLALIEIVLFRAHPPTLPLVVPGVGLSRGALRFRATHRSRRSRPYHPLRTSSATQCRSSCKPPTGQAALENGAARPYRNPPPAPAAAAHRGYGARRSLPLSRWSFHRSLWALRPDASPRPALCLPACSRFSEAAAPPPTGRPASKKSASRPYRSPPGTPPGQARLPMVGQPLPTRH